MKQLKYSVLIIGILVLSGCFDDQQDVAAYVEEVKKTSVGKVEPLPPFKEYKSENYTAQGLRSPFSKSRAVPSNVAVTQEQVGDGEGEEGIKQQPRPDAARIREFLEGFPLSSLNMVGTLNKGTYFWGLVQDASGKVYPVKVGDYIGQNSGRITKIDEDEIYIEETVPDGKGGWMQIQSVMTLKAQ